MNPIQKAALERSIKTIAAMGCTFAILDPDKEMHGSPLTVLDEMGSAYVILDSDGVRHGLVSTILDKMECDYVITTKQGMKYSNTTEETPEVKPVRDWVRGDVRKYVKTFTENLQIGDTVSIPWEKYGAPHVQNSVTSWFVFTYGKGSCTTFINRATGCVDVMRIG